MKKNPTFEDAEKEYYKLPHVSHDPLDEHDVSDFVFRTEHEIILYQEGEEDEDYTPASINKLRKFIAKWKPYQNLKKSTK